ncbi:glyoxylate/hydroxypyruvate reductase A [uncultured Rhodospira sp.]|uniref:2-hydroxyacid dehydrogenase n=1 Tax=uncultured Rhodospira sp. TaxID=1936189 RepID=UPI0026233FE6|nr:glyoxylate/hydroxypyruvate reductase A [uncultured Rhodospira sp.]
MTILFCSEVDCADTYRRTIAEHLPDTPFRAWPDAGPAEAVRYGLVWKPPQGLLGSLPNLKAVFNLGAGVDALMAETEVPAHVPLFRLSDAGMAAQMVEWVLHGVLRFHRRFDVYEAAQADGRWAPVPPRLASQVRVGVMGLGALGGVVAARLADLGYAVRGWSRTPRSVAGVEGFHGRDALPAFLEGTEILVCLLPLTPETRGLLNRETLSRLAPGAAVINAARGAHVVDSDLLALLDSGHIRGAQLDVFDPEPLPPEHPFWAHPKVRLTPHVAAVTLAGPACAQIAETIRRLERGETPDSAVDRTAGY